MLLLIHDETGEGGERAARLQTLIEQKGLEVRCGPPQKSLEASIVLCHSNDVGRLKTTLREIAGEGKLVIVYSGGVFENWDEDGVHYRALVIVEHILGLLQPHWQVENVAALMNQEWMSIRKQGFSALSILAQCASAEFGVSVAAKKRQVSWRSDPQNWTVLLDNIPLPVLQECARAEEKLEAEKLVKWILGSADAPDFVSAAEEAASLA